MMTEVKDHTVEFLDLVYQDEYLVAVNKPYGYLTHKTNLDKYAKEIVLQQLRDQIGAKVYPIHRLDRKTTGLLLFGLQPEIHKAMSQQFMTNEIKKTYFAIVRGYLEAQSRIDYPLENEAGNSQEAITDYETIQQAELAWPLGKHETSRYSLVKLRPQTGRMHQLRRHLAHVRHPIIGDRPHGCSKQNKLFKGKVNFTEMLLHAQALQFRHPVSDEPINLTAKFSAEFIRISEILGLKLPEGMD